MCPMLHPAKLAELRSKTNRELSRVVADGVANAITLVKVAEAHYSLGDFPSGERTFRRASETYAQCNALLPLLGYLPAEARSRLERDLVRVRRALDSLAALYFGLRGSAHRA